MSTSLKALPVVIAVNDGDLLNSSQAALKHFSGATLVTNEVQERAGALAKAVAATEPALLITDLSALGENFSEVIRGMRSQPVPPEVIVLHHSPDGGAILKAMRAGAREFFYEEVENSLREAVKAIALESRPAQGSGKLYAFLAAKGGCGATTLATHAAASMARASTNKVLFADLNWASPSAAFLLRANPQYSLQEAADAMDRMDSALWDAMVTGTKQGFFLAPPPSVNSYPQALKPEGLNSLLRFCQGHYGMVVADCGDGVHHLTPALLRAADEIILVSTTEVLALHHTKRLIRTTRELAPSTPVRLVLNRVRRRPDMRLDEWEGMLGHPVFAAVPNDYRSLAQACEEGTLLPSENQVAKSVTALTEQLAGVVPVRKKRMFGFFS